MLPIFFLATLAWILAMTYHHKCHAMVTDRDRLGLKFVGVFIVSFLVGVTGMYLLSRAAAPVEVTPPAPVSPGESGMRLVVPSEKGLSVLQWTFIGAFTLIFYSTFITLLRRGILHLSGNKVEKALGWSLVSAIVIWGLFLVKVAWNPVLVGNLLLFLIILPAFELSLLIRKSGFLGLFGLIMVLDVFLVWAFNDISPDAAINPIQAVGDNWYVSIFRSKFMHHFPWPVGFRWDGRMLGNGDVFFICLTVMYLKRVWSARAAIVAGLLVTAPLLAIPYVSQLTGITAWPYTIFIAPFALVMALLAPKNVITIPEAWKNLDGEIGVIGRPNKS